MKLKQNLKQFINQFPQQRVAIWGAGHQALAVIALTETADHIKYAIDPAPLNKGNIHRQSMFLYFLPIGLNQTPLMLLWF